MFRENVFTIRIINYTDSLLKLNFSGRFSITCKFNLITITPAATMTTECNN